MRKLLLFLAITCCLTINYQAQTENFEIAKKLGEQAAEFLKESEFDKLHELFSERMAESLTPKRMEKSFSGVFKQLGQLTEIKEFNVKITAEANYYQQAVQFENGIYNLVFALTEDNKFRSFNLKPHMPTYEWSTPVYAAPLTNYTTEQIKIGDNLPLNGELIQPTSGSKITAVFVHGSGPNDMDETTGPNKIFKDLALGLANNGIASIRYNKRTYDYPSAMSKKANSITIQEVVVNDAVHAIQFAREKGAEKVILIGHSLGGYCAPMIAKNAKPDGVIVLAGNASPLEDLLLPQYEYLKENDSTSQISDFIIGMVKNQVERVQKKEYDSTTAPPMLPLNLPASFWLSLVDYNPPKEAKKQPQPYLILNGERDYQVTPKEAKKWKSGSKNKHSKTIIYPNLNHLFFAGSGLCLPAEYNNKSHFSEKVLNDIIDWIKEI